MDALSILLEGLIDYAGLYPPASLPMEAAVRNYAAYLGGPRAAWLGRFVLPAARLDAFLAARQGLDAAPWRLDILGFERTLHVLRGQIIGVHFVQIEHDVDLAIPRAGDLRSAE